MLRQRFEWRFRHPSKELTKVMTKIIMFFVPSSDQLHSSSDVQGVDAALVAISVGYANALCQIGRCSWAVYYAQILLGFHIISKPFQLFSSSVTSVWCCEKWAFPWVIRFTGAKRQVKLMQESYTTTLACCIKVFKQDPGHIQAWYHKQPLDRSIDIVSICIHQYSRLSLYQVCNSMATIFKLFFVQCRNFRTSWTHKRRLIKLSLTYSRVCVEFSHNVVILAFDRDVDRHIVQSLLTCEFSFVLL